MWGRQSCLRGALWARFPARPGAGWKAGGSHDWLPTVGKVCQNCTALIHPMYTSYPSTPRAVSRKLLPARSLAPAIDGSLSCTDVGMAHSGFSNVLKNSGFQAFLWTQFLGAFNDSVYQTIVALHVGNANPAYVPLVPAVFTLPSLLFSGYSGHLADLVSKRRVLIGVKLFEIAIMLFGLTTLVSGWTEGMLLVVFLMGLHADE